MAFLNRVGNVLKQSVSKHVNSQLSPANPSLFQAIRNMSSAKLFVGGLSYNTDELSLRETFSQHGEVVEARVILDRDTGRSRGFGFVTYTSTDDASSAIQALDGQDLHGRRVRVNYATEKSRSGGFGGGGGYGGGYGGQGGGYGGGGYQGGGGYGGGGYQGGGGYGGGGDGNYSGGGGGYGGGNQYPTGGGGGGYGGGNTGYGGGNDAVQGGGGGGYFSSLLDNNETTVSQEPVGGHQGGANAGNGGFGEDVVDGNERDGDDEPSDYANTRG